VAAGKVLAGMMVFSMACMLIHLVRPGWGSEINSKARQIAQPIALLGSLGSRMTPGAAGDSSGSAASAIAQNLSEGQMLALAEEVRTLRQRNAELMGLRAGDCIPPRLGRLIGANVLSRDSLAFRAVQTIDRGTSGGATVGQWVTSAVYLDRGDQDGLKLKRNVFSVESLVGQVVWVGPYTSRIKLLTDPTSRIRVRIARIHPDQPKQPVGYSRDAYVLEGVGSGEMIIQQVDYRLIESGAIQKNDLVVAEPSSDLPEQAASLRRVGRITKIEPDRNPRNSGVYTLTVAPLVDIENLRHVYVFDPTPVE